MQRVLQVVVKQTGAAKATSGIKGLVKAVGGAKLALGALAAATFKVVKSFAETAERSHQLSKAMGLTTQTVQTLTEAARQNGFTIGDVERGMARLRAEGEKVGDLRSPELMLRDLADRLKDTENETERLNLATEMLGRTAGPKMAEFLSQGAEGIEQLRKEMGSAIMTDTQIKNALAFQDVMNKLKILFQGMVNTFAGAFLPVITELVERFEELFQELMPLWNTVVTALVDIVSTAWDFFDVLLEILEPVRTLGKLLVSNVMENIRIVIDLFKLAVLGLQLIVKTVKDVSNATMGWLNKALKPAFDVIRRIMDLFRRIRNLIKETVQEAIQLAEIELGTVKDDTPEAVQVSTPTPTGRPTVTPARTATGARPAGTDAFLSNLIHFKNEFIVFSRRFFELHSRSFAGAGGRQITIQVSGDGVIGNRIAEGVRDVLQQIDANQRVIIQSINDHRNMVNRALQGT